MESGFGQSFDGVRVHHDSTAGGLADSISARAFTLGNDVFFGAGQYQPHTPDGRRLIAHEFAHVVQGSDGRVAQPSLWRQPKRQTTAAPTTGDKPGTTPMPSLRRQASDGPARFDSKKGVALSETVPNKTGERWNCPPSKCRPWRAASKARRTIRSRRSGVPQGQIRSSPASRSNTGGDTTRLGHRRQTWIGAAVKNDALQKALKAQIETPFGGGATAPASAKGGGSEEDPAPLAQGEDTSYPPAESRRRALFHRRHLDRGRRPRICRAADLNKKNGAADFDVDTSWCSRRLDAGQFCTRCPPTAAADPRSTVSSPRTSKRRSRRPRRATRPGISGSRSVGRPTFRRRCARQLAYPLR